MLSHLKTLQNDIFIELTKTLSNVSDYLSMTERGYSDNFQEMKNEDIVHEFKRRESYFDKQYELIKRCEMMKECQKSIERLFEEFKYTYEVFVLDSSSTREKVGNHMNKQLEKMKIIDRDFKKQNFSDEYEKENYTDRIIQTELTRKQKQIQEDNIRKRDEEEKRQHLSQLEDERKSKADGIQKMLTTIEYEYIEKWTDRKIGDLIFDTKKDSWKEGSSVFHSRIMGRGELIFLIEDTIGNKFGYYSAGKIQLNKFSEWVKADAQTFLFSLNSNGRMDKPMKFEIINQRNGYQLFPADDYKLIWFGGKAINLLKAGHKGLSTCTQNDSSFDYHGVQNALCGKEGSFGWTAKRIIVIQMNQPF